MTPSLRHRYAQWTWFIEHDLAKLAREMTGGSLYFQVAAPERPTLTFCSVGLFVVALSGYATAAQEQPAGPAPASSQRPHLACTPGTLHHPKGPGRGRWRLGAGAELDILPRVLVEAEVRYVPRLRAEFRYGLPAQFQLDIGVSGNIFMNELRAGATWSFAAGPLHIGLRDRFGLFGGAIGVSGFDASVWGFSNTPSLTVGLPIQNSFLSLRTEALFTLSQSIRFGETVVQPSYFPLASVSESIRIETPVGKGLIAYGIDLIYAVADQQLWLVFSDQKGRALFPRFSLAYVF